MIGTYYPKVLETPSQTFNTTYHVYEGCEF